MTTEPLPPAAEDIRAALDCLYENLALAETRLASLLPGVAAVQPVQERAQALRSALLGGIEMLQPARREPFGSRAARSYEVLNLRYVEGLSVVQAADELNVVERQVYRDLRQAYEDLARVLASRSRPQPAAAAVVGVFEGTPIQDELARLVARPRRLDLAQVLQASLQAVRPLATRLRVSLTADVPPCPAPVSADEGILRQVLTQVLSLAIQSTAAVLVRLTASPGADQIVLTVSFRADRQPLREEGLHSLHRLAEAQHLRLAVDHSASGCVVTVSMGVAEPRTLLVIEDNSGAIELYRRYLAESEDWQVVGAADPRLSYDMALRLRPAAIVLDIMMPQQDGWTVLQLLRTQPQTATTPIIICSVFEDPVLAAALGADASLKKPVTQAEFAAALARATGE
ncbi:MAG: ATP-binding response regulator [Anaerolineae bacterium]